MGHSWFYCPECGDMVPDCDCCWDELDHYCSVAALHDARIRGALLALSRVAVWVAMEAQANRMFAVEFGWLDRDSRRSESMSRFRRTALTDAMFSGRLKLAYPGETHEPR